MITQIKGLASKLVWDETIQQNEQPKGWTGVDTPFPVIKDEVSVIPLDTLLLNLVVFWDLHNEADKARIIVSTKFSWNHGGSTTSWAGKYAVRRGKDWAASTYFPRDKEGEYKPGTTKVTVKLEFHYEDIGWITDDKLTLWVKKEAI